VNPKVATVAGAGEIREHHFKLRKYSETTLKNGLRVLMVEDGSLPYIAYGMLVETGSSSDPETMKGLGNFVASLLEKGSQKRDAIKIADALAQIGADFNVSVSADFTYISASGLSIHESELLSLYSELITTPSFSPSEVERVRAQIKAAIAQRADDADSFAEQAFQSFIYPNHPYGHNVLGTAKEISQIRRRAIIRHYLQFYRPNNAILTVVGKFDSGVVSRLEKSFGGWKPRTVAPVKIPSFPPVHGIQIEFVEKPGLDQTQIVIGGEGITRKNPDYLTLKLVNNILGTGFSSRLVSRIRDQLGLTYNISSEFDARFGVGPFYISTFTRHEKVGETVREILKVVETFSRSGVRREELDLAKSYLSGNFLRAVETAEKLAFNLLALRFYGISDDYLADFEENINHVSYSDVNSAIEKYIHPKDLKILVYSVKGTLPQLQGIGTLVQKSFKDIN
jgi:zinc protease